MCVFFFFVVVVVVFFYILNMGLFITTLHIGRMLGKTSGLPRINGLNYRVEKVIKQLIYG